MSHWTPRKHAERLALIKARAAALGLNATLPEVANLREGAACPEPEPPEGCEPSGGCRTATE